MLPCSRDDASSLVTPTNHLRKSTSESDVITAENSAHVDPAPHPRTASASASTSLAMTMRWISLVPS